MTSPLPHAASAHAEASSHPLLSAAEAMFPRLSARSEEIENARRLPPDLAAELARDGYFRMMIPEALGGLELHPAVSFQVMESIAKADGSTGWCVMIGAATALTAAWMFEPAARAIFTRPDVITGGVAAPIGRAEHVEGGYRLSGRWPWASGAQHCHWLVGGAIVTEGGKPRMVREGVPEMRSFFFPAERAVLHDTWFAQGLCGTGSVDMEAKDVFVPDEYTFSLSGQAPRIARPLYGYAFGLLGMGISAVALGIARRAIDELMSLAGRKTLMLERRLLSARPAAQEAIADAEATVRSARAFMLEALNTIHAESTRGPVSVRTRAELRLAMTHATRSAARAVDRMYEAAGGTAVFRASPLQRCFRDVHTATQHAMVSPATLELTGGLLLGLELPTFTL
ncbi:acyl-CoA dehydrogenase family protein [Pyxidicoccus parkwayensis]|uniref:Acyl-CoA dehydrogenase family protein n=1 Tax=Pyxidicoccus parkwayensis TaxID=2813578 RepID=A0ABX7NMC3_9BACT|nr:acyl-CoA dehydrogenase family protein [Pyxidicoccus parkwaysis]QSQ20025.1 acyl-CoA dehydrogenase family protein [Pyxidicoccus parkwaysis]